MTFVDIRSNDILDLDVTKTHNSERNSRNLVSSKGEGAQRFCLWAFLGLNILLPDSFWTFWDIWAYSLNVLKAFLHNIKWFFSKCWWIDFSVFVIGSPSIASSSLAKLPSRVESGLGKSRWIVGSSRTKMAAAIAGLPQAQNQGKQQGGVASERSLRSVFGTF